MSTPLKLEQRYNVLPQDEAFLDDAGEKEQETLERSQPRKKSLSSIVLRTVFILFALFGIVDLLRIAALKAWSVPSSQATLTDSGYVQKPHQRPCRCGSTIEEAKSNNCTYDSMAAAWLPPHCIDFELLREWEKAGDGPNGEWEYFADQHREIPLTLEEVAHLPQREDVQNAFFVSMAWHVKHCAFAWRKEYRSAATGVTMDRRSSGLHHIAHCEMMFLKRNDLSDLVTRVGVVMDADEGDEELE